VCIYIYIYIYDISNLRVKFVSVEAMPITFLTRETGRRGLSSVSRVEKNVDGHIFADNREMDTTVTG